MGRGIVWFWVLMFALATVAWFGVLKAGTFMPAPWGGAFVGCFGLIAARAQWECVRQGIAEWHRR